MASTQAPARLRSQPLLARYRRPWIGWLQVFTAGLMLLGPLPSRASWSDTDSDSQNDTWTDPTSNQMTALADMNSQNTDVDGDGATNDEEAAEGSDPYSYDTDRDGLNDGDELHLVKPSLGVSLTNWDSDSDFVSDYDEWYNFSGVTYPGGQLPELPYASYSDYDGDGIKNPVDADPTDPSNPSTTDSDGDGIMNSSDPFPSDSSNYSSVNSYYWYGDVFGDADGDGTPNWQDSDPYSTNMPTTTGDSDGDGIQDGQDPYPNDSTNYSSVNGIAWHVDFSGDADSDGILNHVDPEPYGPQTQDADSDGFVDSVDPFPNDSTNYSSVNGTTWYENVLGDADGDGTPNWQDNEPFGTPDADSDGFADSYDPYPYDSTNYSATNGVSWYADVNGDADGDFTLNWADSTPYPEPPSSTDADGDGLDDASDPAPNDSSNYSYYNNQPWYAEALWDADNDGTQNWYDAWPTDPYNGTWSDPDTDMDGMTDSIDPYPNDPWNNSDSDADGLTDLQEVGFGSASGFGTDPYDVDTDNDYLSDYEEVYVYSTNPLLEKTDPNQLYPDFYHVPSADTDGDTLPDNVEDWYTILGYGLDKTTPGDAQGDLDGDGITNAQAYNVGWSLVANLVTYDLDGDGITDVREDYWSLIHPGILNKAVFADAVQDPDNDGVMNFEEIELGTNPGISDTNLAYLFWRTVVVDEIGLLPNPGSRRGGWRIAGTLNVSNWKSSYDERGTPADPSDPLSQEHGNGIPDGLDAFLLDTSDLANNIPTRVAADDFDGDGLSDVWEYKHHLGLRDRWNAQPPADWQPGMTPPTPSSIFGARYEPTDWDADEDQLTNLEEYLVGTDPRAADSDSDEYTDREEVLAGTDPLDSNSYPVEQPDPGEVLPPNPGGAGPSPSAAKMAQMLPAGTPLDKSLGGFSTEDGAPPPNPPIVEYDIQTIDEEGQASPVHTVRSESASFWHYPAPEEPEPGCGCGGNSFSSQCICGGHWAEVDDYTQPLPDGTFVKMSEWVSDCECLEYTPPNNFSRSKGKVRVRFSNPITRGMRFEFQEIRSVTGGNAYPSTVEVHIPKGGTQGETRQYDPSENELYVITYSGVVEEEPDPPSSSPPFTLTASDGAGPRYRKIGLNGAPLPDSKPQVQDESGELPEETYIDALTRELRHSVTEVYASMESSLLPLMVRRDVVEDTWNAKSGLRADERADRPFGSGWTSNITSHVRLEDGLKIYVTDEQGASQVFLRDPANDGGWIHTKEERVDTKAGMNTLHSVMVDNKLVGFTYRKKFGTTCHYRKCALIQTFPANRVKGEGDLITNQYFRLWKVEDRLGNSLVYTYPSTKTLIPYTIADPQRQGHYISIRQEGGVVTQVRGPGGDTASYNYEMVDGAPVLTEVKRGGATVKYAYSAETELDPNEPPPDEDPTPVRHIAVNKITDENGGSYTFNLQFNTGVTYTKFQDDGPQLCHQIGLPRYVTNVQLPDGSNTQVDGIRTLHVESPSLEGVVAEASTNVNGPGGSTSYTFSDLDVFVPLVPDIDNIDDPFSRHLTVSFQKMEVSRGGGTETYEFDVEHAMSLVQATDRNGNSTDFSYDWFDDPASETNAMNGVKTFTYDPLTRVMASVTDEAGTRTEYTIQAGTGLRTEERIIGSGGTVRRTEFKYEDSKFRGFLTRKIVQSSGNMPSYTVQYTPDSVGRVHEEKVIGGGTTKYYHDYAGNKRFVVDPRGNCTEFTYDARYRLRRVTHPDASRKHLVYDLHGNLTQEINELGARTTHQYDALNRRVKSTVEMTDADDIVLTTSYNGMNLPVVETTPNRPNTTHGYDALGRRTSTQTGPLHTTFEYGSNSGSSVFDVSGFKPTKSTGPRGVVTTVQYDDMYRAVSTTVSDGGTTTTEYDAVGRPVEVTDALGRSTTTTYDALGQAIRVDLPDGTEVETKYTQLGKPWWVKDGLGRITETEYDSAGRAISVTNPLGQTVHSEYDAAGNAIKVTDARGHITESSYDSRNRPIEVKAPAVVNGETGQSERPITTTTYDAAGKPLSVTDPLGHVTLNTYDQASRVVKVKNALHQETLTTYDASGNVLTVTDANGKVTTNEYDSLGRLSLTTDAEGVLTEFDYDLSGNRTMVKDGKGNVTTFDYDLQNRVTEEHYANGDETTYTYNALQKLTRTDAAGTTSYTYDNLNRLLTVDFVTGPDRAYAYDDAGQLLSVTETGHAAADVSYTYDLAGKVLSETSRGKTHTYTYDAAGNRTGTTYSTGRSETRTYDALNRIATLVEGGRTTTWHYDLAGRAIALTLGNGQQQDNHYDAVGKLTARHLFNPNQTLIATFQWQHDAVGNVSQQTERWLGDATRNNALRTTTMAYDDVYRLLGETVTQSGEITKETLYTYDDASNRASKVEKENTVVVKDTSYTYNTANQLTAWSEENGAEVVRRSAVMTYDTRGNRASTAITTHGEVPTTATSIYTWTPQNMLASVTLPDSSVHSYAYDYRVRRITRTEGSTTPVAMTFSGGLSVAEFEVLDPGTGTLNTQPTVEYQRGPDMGGGVGGLLYSLRSGTAKFNLSNGRGDVVAQSDSSGSLTWTASYEAYGKRPVETGSNLDRQRANTKEEDPTGLVNEGFRYRDLETGVWLSRDPAGFVDGPNLYAYCVQNPWTKFDPDGLRWRMTGFGITIEFGAHQPYGIGLYAARPSDADFCDVNLTDFKEGGKRLDALKRSPGEFLKGAAGGFLGTDWGSNTEEGRKGRSVGGNVAVLDAAASMGRAGVAGMSGRSGPPPVPVGTGGVAVAPVAVPKEIPTPLIPANTLFQQTEESQQPTESTKNTLVDYKEIVRRFLSKRDAKDAVKNGIPFDPNKGAGISTTTTTIEPVDPDAIRKMTGAANADFYIDINITGKARLNTVTKGGKADIKIQEDIKPEDVIDKGRVRKSNESVIDNE